MSNKRLYLVVVEDGFKPYIDSHYRDADKQEAIDRVAEINKQAGAKIATLQIEELTN